MLFEQLQRLCSPSYRPSAHHEHPVDIDQEPLYIHYVITVMYLIGQG
jgi:hypothetical protein